MKATYTKPVISVRHLYLDSPYMTITTSEDLEGTGNGEKSSETPSATTQFEGDAKEDIWKWDFND